MAIWTPQPGPQLAAIQARWCDELFYGGSRGGGKTDFGFGDWLQDVETYGSAWQGIWFRKSYPDLEDAVLRSHELFEPLGAKWREKKHRWEFPNGAILRFRALEREKDAYKYQGHQYTWIHWEELTLWSDLGPYNLLKSCLRSPHDVEFKRIRANANPGGPGHFHVRKYFGIDDYPSGYHLIEDEETGMRRMYLPARLSDNRILVDSDPGYEGRIRGSGPPELVKAWLDGDWDVVLGGFFPEFREDLHVIDDMHLPREWTRFAACDWGYKNHPFCVLWFAVADGNWGGFPKGSLIVYREWYGGENGKGVDMPASIVAKGILERERGERISYRVIDPSSFRKDSGPSVAEIFRRNGVVFRGADRNREAGWQNIREKLAGVEGIPLLYVMRKCRNLIRTFPLVQYDILKVNDMATDGDDHALDTLRYGNQSRYGIRESSVAEDMFYEDKKVTWGDICRAHEEKKARGRFFNRI